MFFPVDYEAEIRLYKEWVLSYKKNRILIQNTLEFYNFGVILYELRFDGGREGEGNLIHENVVYDKNRENYPKSLQYWWNFRGILTLSQIEGDLGNAHFCGKFKCPPLTYRVN